MGRRPGRRHPPLGSERGLPDMRLGERVAELRKERGWSQAELGRRVGVAGSTIMRIERGADQNISQSTLMGLAVAFGVAPAILLGDAPAHAGPPLAQLRAAGFGEAELRDLAARWPGLSEAKRGRFTRAADVVYTQHERLEAELHAEMAALEAERERAARQTPQGHTGPAVC